MASRGTTTTRKQRVAREVEHDAGVDWILLGRERMCVTVHDLYPSLSLCFCFYSSAFDVVRKLTSRHLPQEKKKTYTYKKESKENTPRFFFSFLLHLAKVEFDDVFLLSFFSFNIRRATIGQGKKENKKEGGVSAAPLSFFSRCIREILLAVSSASPTSHCIFFLSSYEEQITEVGGCRSPLVAVHNTVLQTIFLGCRLSEEFAVICFQSAAAISFTVFHVRSSEKCMRCVCGCSRLPFFQLILLSLSHLSFFFLICTSNTTLGEAVQRLWQG